MSDQSCITVEFFGIPRQRAGCASALVTGRTVGDVLTMVEQKHPGLRGLLDNGGVAAHYRVSIDGKRFVTRLDTPVQPAEHILILSADAGG